MYNILHRKQILQAKGKYEEVDPKGIKVEYYMQITKNVKF